MSEQRRGRMYRDYPDTPKRVNLWICLEEENPAGRGGFPRPTEPKAGLFRTPAPVYPIYPPPLNKRVWLTRWADGSTVGQGAFVGQSPPAPSRSTPDSRAGVLPIDGIHPGRQDGPRGPARCYRRSRGRSRPRTRRGAHRTAYRSPPRGLVLNPRPRSGRPARVPLYGRHG
jgi:hypothetical protein